MKRKTVNVLGVLLCMALAFIGVLFYWTHKDAAFYTSKYGSPVTEELDRVEFGADFYTYSYEASAYAANGIRNIYRALVEAISAAFFVGGSIGICFFGAQLASEREEEKRRLQTEGERKAAGAAVHGNGDNLGDTLSRTEDKMEEDDKQN